MSGQANSKSGGMNLSKTNFLRYFLDLIFDGKFIFCNYFVKFCQEKNNWISTKIALPELLPNENYSKNVLAFCNGQLMIMCYCYNPSEDDSENGFFWANCNGQIDGDAEFDDEYDVKFWQPLPSVEGLSA
jgi:hypothetical protein